MFLRNKDKVVFISGEDFQGRSLVGVEAIIINTLGPDSKEAHVRFPDKSREDAFFPKKWLRVLHRAEK